MKKTIKLKKANVPDSHFNKAALEKGIKVEYEHTNDHDVAKAIAKAHLMEDPKYYEKLKKYVEKGKKQNKMIPLVNKLWR